MTPLTSPRPEIKTEDSPQDGSKSCQSCSNRPQQQQIMPLVIVVTNANGSASAGAPVFTVAKTGGMRTITPLVSVLRSAHRQPVASDAVCLSMTPSPIASSTSSEEVTVISPTPSDTGPKSDSPGGSQKDLSPKSATGGTRRNKGGPKTTRRITTQESPELRRMVDSDPNLTTIQNRFRNTSEEAVPSPLHKYFRNQLDKRKEKETSMESQSAVASPSVTTPTCTVNHMETMPPVTTASAPSMPRVTAGCHVNVAPVPATNYGQNQQQQHQVQVNMNNVPPSVQTAHLLGNFPAVPVTTQQPSFVNTAQTMRFNFNPPQPQTPGEIPMNTQLYAPQQLQQEVGSLPSPSDIELDFDTDLFDATLADINPSSLTGPGMQTSNSVQSHSSTSTGSSFNQGQQTLQNLSLDDSNNATMATISMTTGGQLQENELVPVTEFSPDWSYPEVMHTCCFCL